ncbi:MAG: phage major capsid protein [Pseudomonadota bacterium]
MTNCTRTFKLDRKQANGAIFPATLTTSDPVRRDFGYEVLDMERLDLSRAPFPLIEGHDQSRLNIGVVENVRVEGDRLRGDIRLGSSDRAREVADDIRAGIVTGISVGYEVSEPTRGGDRDGVEIYRFAAQILEVSLVAVPADKRAGINRSKSTMSEQVTEPATNQAEQKRLDGIQQIADRFGLRELSFQAMTKGWSIEQFNQMALTEIQGRNHSAQREPNLIQSSPGTATFAGRPISGDSSVFADAMRDYSLSRLLRGLADPKCMDNAKHEIAVSDILKDKFGSRGNTVRVPFEALGIPQTRAVTVSGTSGSSVATDHLSGDFIDVLRNRSLVMNLGPRVLRGLQGDVDIPKKTGSASSFWLNFDNVDTLAATDLTLDQVSLSPKTVGGATVFSHKMLIQSSPDIESMVREDLAAMIAVEIDRVALNGTGASNQPTGILNQAGIGAGTYTSGSPPTRGNIISLETLLSNANADDRGALNYLTTPELAASLRQVDVGTDTGQFVWMGNNREGRMEGYPAHGTNQIPTGTVLLGYFPDLIIGFWGGIEIDVDPYSEFLKGNVTVRVLADIDISVRHSASFAKLEAA